MQIQQKCVVAEAQGIEEGVTIPLFIRLFMHPYTPINLCRILQIHGEMTQHPLSCYANCLNQVPFKRSSKVRGLARN
jgi:hypothetical protein